MVIKGKHYTGINELVFISQRNLWENSSVAKYAPHIVRLGRRMDELAEQLYRYLVLTQVDSILQSANTIFWGIVEMEKTSTPSSVRRRDIDQMVRSTAQLQKFTEQPSVQAVMPPNVINFIREVILLARFLRNEAKHYVK